jgi:hypothetical protein
VVSQSYLNIRSIDWVVFQIVEPCATVSKYAEISADMAAR